MKENHSNTAPNGRPSNLSPEDWAYVRSEEFKAWAGDWEHTYRLEKLKRSSPISISGTEIGVSDNLVQLKKMATQYGKSIRGVYVNEDTGKEIRLASGRHGGIKEVLEHDYKDIQHLQSVAAIPSIIQKGIYICSLPNEDINKNPGIREYEYYVCGLRIKDEDYTVKAVFAIDRNGDKYYDHKLTEIEKGELLAKLASMEVSGQTGLSSDMRQEGAGQHIPTAGGVESNVPSLSDVKDKRLISILQKKSSLLLDENGEPKAFYHGTTREFEAFDLSHAGDNTGLTEYADNRTGEKVVSDSSRCIFFSDSFHQAASYAMLRHHGEVGEQLARVQGVFECILTAKLRHPPYDTKEEFLRDVEALKDEVPALRELPERISPLTKEQREPFLAPLRELRTRLREEQRAMDNGGLSNQLYNIYLQRKTVDSLRGNLDRMRRNDLDTPNEFGTFRTYTQSVFGASGNTELIIREQDGRLVFHDLSMGPQGAVFIDTMTDREAADMATLMSRKCDEAEIAVREHAVTSGYNTPSRVYRVFLKAERPFSHDYQGSAFPDSYKPNKKYPTAYIAARQVAAAERQGCDAVVYEHVRDPFEATTVGVFSPEQVMIREMQKGVVNVQSVREKDLAGLKELGLAQEDIDRVVRYGGAIVATEDGSRMTVAVKDDGIVIHGADGLSLPLGQALHEAKKDASFINRLTGTQVKCPEPILKDKRKSGIKIVAGETYQNKIK